MTFPEAKDVAILIGGQLDQAVNISIITITGIVAFALKYWREIPRSAKILLVLGLAFLVVSALCSYANKGLLITVLLEIANKVEESKRTATLDQISMYSFFQFIALLSGLFAAAIAAYLSRYQVFKTSHDKKVSPIAREIKRLKLSSSRFTVRRR